ncbi:hypothetical protein [Lactobacillus sp. ESL0703]
MFILALLDYIDKHNQK